MFENVSVVTKLNLFLGLLAAALLATIGLFMAGLPSGAELAFPVQAAIATVFVAALAGGVWLRIEVRNSILRNIRAAAHVINRVAEGDLTARVGVTAHGETQKMLEGLEGMTRDLRKLVSEVARGANVVADTSAQIAQGNLDLSQRTEEQASTLEETASSIEELTSTVAHNADNARQASKLAAEASETAKKGGEVVDEVVRTMDGILDASRRISDIIGVIDSIAFQTNILALNAAVEAARAGEQGRGFAVVAAEVRNLAHRTTAAAKEIKGLIADSQQKVQAGSDRVDAAGHTMVGVVMSVQKVSSLIAEIAAASQEQSAGIGQVNTAVSQMERVVQQNASLVEEASAATEALREQAQSLLQLVARFKLGDEALPKQPPSPAPTPRVAPPARDTAPPPIQVRPKGTALPPAYAAAIANATRKKPAAGNGHWEEF